MAQCLHDAILAQRALHQDDRKILGSEVWLQSLKYVARNGYPTEPGIRPRKPAPVETSATVTERMYKSRGLHPQLWRLQLPEVDLGIAQQEMEVFRQQQAREQRLEEGQNG